MGNLSIRSRRASFGRISARGLALVCAALSGCDRAQPSAPAPAVLRVVAGANQSGSIGSTLPLPVIAQVQDPVAGARAGVRLRPRVVGGGSVSPAEAVTDANGEAAFLWTLAAAPGLQEMVIEDVTVTLRATVTATALTASPVETVAVAPDAVTLSPGQTQQLNAVLRDAQGALLTGRAVTWTSSNSAVASVSPTTGFVSANTIGSATVTATSETKTGTAIVTVSTTTPTPVATSLRVVTQPGGALTGVVFATQPVVEVLDQNGARLMTATTPVTVARGSGTGTLGGTVTVTAVAGVATFTNLSITGSGAHSLAFSATGLTGVSSQSFTVGAGSVATSLAITTQPSGAVIGVDLTTQPVVEVRDGSGALFTASNVQVTATVASANGFGGLSGTTTVTAVNGVATFTNLRMSAGAGGTTTLSFTSPGLTSAISAGFSVSAAAATPTLSSIRNPAIASDGVVFGVQPIVHVLTIAGSLDLSSSVPVTASIASGTGTLGGTTTVSAVGGIATFTNLRITGSGAHTLQYSSPGIASTTSASFNVTATPSLYSLDIGNATPANVQAGQNISIPVILDLSNAAGGNVGSVTFGVSWDASKFTFVSGTMNGAAGFTLVDNTSNAAVGGSLMVSGFATIAATTTRTLYTVVLTAKASAVNSTSIVNGSVSAAADINGNNITIAPRNLAVNITP